MNNILNVIFVYLLFIAIFVFIYAFTWGLVRNYFVRFTIYYQAIIGGVYAILAIVAESLIPIFVKDININILVIYLPLIVCWLIGVFISWISIIMYTTFIFIFTFVIANFFQTSYFYTVNYPIDIITMMLLYLITFVIIIIVKLFKWTQWTNWSLLTLVAFIFNSIMILIQVKDKTWANYLLEELVVLIWIGMSYLAYLLGAGIELIYNHALKLQNIIEYDRSKYLREALAHEAIYDYIHRNKIRRGLYLTFAINNINALDRFLTSNLKNKIIDLISQQVFKAWEGEDVIFFKASLNNFGIFVPIPYYQKINIAKLLQDNQLKTRHADDLLKKFEKIIQGVETTYKYQNYNIIVKLQGYASFYGLQSNNLDKLKDYNLFAAENRLNLKYNNQVIVVNPASIMALNRQKRSILTLNENVSLQKILSLFSSVIDVNNQFSVLGHYATNLINGNEVDSFLDQNIENVTDTIHEEVLLRYNAALNIKNFRKFKEYLNYQLFLTYSASFLASKSFNLKKFVAKLIELKINTANLILTFDLKEIGFDTQRFQKNLASLKELGIKIAVKNLGALETDISSLGYYQPNYAILAPILVTKMFLQQNYQTLIAELAKLTEKLQITLIAPHVNSYLTYKRIKELGINYMFGTLFGVYEEPQGEILTEIKFALFKNEMKGLKNEIKK
ncbi:EAL domain-containing protein [Spiroplasma chrysopicola]|uniref:EAL domain-containing protein n=1 Tax=Spiroplasma chrysopicola DF-1 TaxID=1276227 RepID=R4U2F4_9MOLU|nr:EAL domain-containing protein [Spiroplasma chrysopicola]AGM25552.1 hypothetical protein SCHRY_v1c09800 [Spiroplasma chrysopicola DF-1]